MDALAVKSPLDLETMAKLHAGTRVLLSGVIYTARDAAHQRLVAELKQTGKVPFGLQGQTIYYAGPSPARPGQIIGSVGPTTSNRMDVYTPPLMEAGILAMIGKGERSEEVRKAMRRCGAVYLVATGGVGALLAETVKKAEIIAYEDLGAEAINKLEVVDFPAIVAYDIYGGDLFQRGRAEYKRV